MTELCPAVRLETGLGDFGSAPAAALDCNVMAPPAASTALPKETVSPPAKAELARFLFERRELAGLSRKRVALDIKVSYQSLYWYETGKRRPAVETLAAWCKRVGVSDLERHYLVKLRRLAA